MRGHCVHRGATLWHRRASLDAFSTALRHWRATLGNDDGLRLRLVTQASDLCQREPLVVALAANKRVLVNATGLERGLQPVE
ncbi:MAG TPA: hypothetical protein VHW01_08320, partial [Polyangiaceae bacterium]|nr:hypothetical protein [Polyangiaceae bacterium]